MLETYLQNVRLINSINLWLTYLDRHSWNVCAEKSYKNYKNYKTISKKICQFKVDIQGAGVLFNQYLSEMLRELEIAIARVITALITLTGLRQRESSGFLSDVALAM